MHVALRWLPAAASIVAAAALAAPLRRFLAEDVCLDRGGRVLHETLRCELASDYTVPLASFPGATSGTWLLAGTLIILGLGATVLLTVLHRRDHRRASS